jgi:hypothetical protein
MDGWTGKKNTPTGAQCFNGKEHVICETSNAERVRGAREKHSETIFLSLPFGANRAVFPSYLSLLLFLYGFD